MQNGTLTETLQALPVAAVMDALAGALTRHASAVLVAPPGAGKTTLVPLALMQAPWMTGQRILLLAPRRLAARAAAQRMASLLGERVGATVGYRIRMESRVGPETRIEVVTEGVLTRMLQSGPGLTGVGLVIFDEFHERSLEADLGLALCREVQQVFNTALRLLVMSATLETAPVAALLGEAPLIESRGRTHPVQTRYLPPDSRQPDSRQPIEAAVADAIRRSVAAGEGSLLAFLPGAPEIHRVARRLESAGLPEGWCLAPLFGNLSRARQDQAITPAPAGTHKIVLATSIAETSLTIEGIRVVVDSGLRRASQFDPRSGMTRLVTLPVSRASADQRRGRAGRLGPGICYRLWSQAAHANLAAYNRPEILEADLTSLVLELAQWGVADPGELAWLDLPPAGACAQARELLRHLGGLDADGRISAHGRRMAGLPLHPRLAHMILSAEAQGIGAAACDLAALLSERDPLRFDGDLPDADLQLRLEVLDALRANAPVSLHAGRVDQGVAQRIRKAARDLCRRRKLRHGGSGPVSAGRLLAWAYPDRIARRRAGAADRYLLANGRGAYFSHTDPLCAHEFLVIAELDGQRRNARIYTAAAYDLETLMDQFEGQVIWREAVGWDARRRAVVAERRLTLGALVLQRESLADPHPDALMAAMVAGIRAAGLDALPWTRGLRTWQARVMVLRRHDADAADWPDVSDAVLRETLETWLGPYLAGITSLKALGGVDLGNALRSQLAWPLQQRLDQLAPTHWVVPSGSRRPIDYSVDPPVLAVRLQEMFGAVQTPAIAKGRLPLQLHLLSPAGRPAQITQDLAGFWRNSYDSVKKDLKGRYPKHYWPDDPLTARPTARVRPRGK